jgi:hypothetical protein
MAVSGEYLIHDTHGARLDAPDIIRKLVVNALWSQTGGS